MATLTASTCTTAITQPTSTQTDVSENCSQAQAKKLSSAQRQAMQCLCGEGLSTQAANAVSTAPYSETKAITDPQTSYARRIQLLMRSGLVAGITPTSVRKRSDQQTLGFASLQPDGSDVAKRGKD
jgi:hypothetical protein